MKEWLSLNAKQRKAMKWVAGLGHDCAVSPGAIGWLLENGYLNHGSTLTLTDKGKAAWAACPEWEKD